eukprot:gene748-1828_t
MGHEMGYGITAMPKLSTTTSTTMGPELEMKQKTKN